MAEALDETKPPPIDSLRRSGGFKIVDFVRGFVQSSPWLVIAIAVHVVVLAVFAVVKLGHSGAAKEDNAIITTAIGAKKPVEELPPEEEKPPDPIDRKAVPENAEAELVSNEVAQLLPQDQPVDPNRDLSQDIGDPNSVSDMPNSDPTGGTSIGVGNQGGHKGTGVPSAFVGRHLGTGMKKGVAPSGATQGTEEAIRLGLIWLVRHQNDNGSWSAVGCKDHCPPGKPCQPETGRGDAGYSDKADVGLSGLSLLCFLGAGYGHNAKQFVVDTFKAKKSELGKDVVLKGLKWLVGQQRDDGSFTDAADRSMYNEAIATLALTEAYGITMNKTWKEPAQKAINFLCSAQRDNPTGSGKWGWRYLARKDVEDRKAEFNGNEKEFQTELHLADVSVTGWCVMALKSAIVSGLEVPGAATEGALAFVKAMSDPRSGLVGYYNANQAGVEIGGDHSEEYKYHVGSMAAVAMCVRTFLEQNIDDPYLKLSAEQLVKSLPSSAADPKKKSQSLVDYYYWYYGALALNQLDGPDAPKRTNKYWAPWNKAMQDSILAMQSHEDKQCSTGGFLTPDRWSYGVGPIYTTAINILTLEVYYRYENAFGAAANKRMKKGGHDKPGPGEEQPQVPPTDNAEPGKKNP